MSGDDIDAAVVKARRNVIIDYLSSRAAGSAYVREQAIRNLNRHGYTDEEISKALSFEATRLAMQRARITALNDSLKRVSE